MEQVSKHHAACLKLQWFVCRVYSLSHKNRSRLLCSFQTGEILQQKHWYVSSRAGKHCILSLQFCIIEQHEMVFAVMLCW